ncbi:hypothetical protein CUT44_23500 [Streptomyces carminius]|uniref:Uncharacterized protein n=1 Tax=Streptomyces carminius TaxID=2665496 RepID=A0A2M8LTJ6_9ACTN|nr:hypothetical protein [Streptomyces carminius]PJE95281.1 hypothetical protein CUT44_23500 [Streptomyces carminius]
MSDELSSVIAATARWLVRSYPTADGVFSAALAEAQARQAVTVAAWLRYPTPLDAALVVVAGPGGARRLDRITGSAPPETGERAEAAGLSWIPAPRDPGDDGDAWRTWVDEVLASWAACLLTSPRLAREAAAAASRGEHARGLAVDFRRLTAPDEYDRRAAPLLRHPDLLAPVAGLHRAEFLRCLRSLRGPEVPEAGAAPTG